MRIVIRLDAEEPPVGEVRLTGRGRGEGLPFCGWLGLLRALYDLLRRRAN